MDKPTTPAGGNSSGFPRPEDSGSEPSFGATGAFGILKGPEEVEKPAAVSAIKPEPEKIKPLKMTGQFPALGGKPLEEPVVHKVVFGGPEEGSAELLDRIRMASSVERPAFKERAPAGQPDAQGSSGFTQLLRSLGGESPASTPAARQTPVPETHKPAPISGFTSLLQTLNAPDPKAVAAAPAIKPIQVDVRPPSPEPPKAPPPSPAPAPVDSKRGNKCSCAEQSSGTEAWPWGNADGRNGHAATGRRCARVVHATVWHVWKWRGGCACGEQPAGKAAWIWRSAVGRSDSSATG